MYFNKIMIRKMFLLCGLLLSSNVLLLAQVHRPLPVSISLCLPDQLAKPEANGTTSDEFKIVFTNTCDLPIKIRKVDINKLKPDKFLIESTSGGFSVKRLTPLLARVEGGDSVENALREILKFRSSSEGIIELKPGEAYSVSINLAVLREDIKSLPPQQYLAYKFRIDKIFIGDESWSRVDLFRAYMTEISTRMIMLRSDKWTYFSKKKSD